MKDFINGLRLRIEITPATDHQFCRVSQQTFRTNQFNFTTVRRSEKEIKDFLKNKSANCLVVRVEDRFGEYGLVGVLMYETMADCYKVDTFLLSCRVLGRGVEHAVASWLGQCAVKEGKRFVEFTYLPTGKNSPALDFITSIGSLYQQEEGRSWILPAKYLASVKYDPEANAPIGHELPVIDNPEKLTPHPPLALGAAGRSERLQRIGEHLFDIHRLVEAIEQCRLTKQPLHAASEATPANNLEMALTNIWKKVLGRPRIGRNENFFEVGETSLRAVQVIAEIKKELKHTLSIVSLFECPTVALLAARLSETFGVSRGETGKVAAAIRGQQRRYNRMRRRAS